MIGHTSGYPKHPNHCKPWMKFYTETFLAGCSSNCSHLSQHFFEIKKIDQVPKLTLLPIQSLPQNRQQNKYPPATEHTYGQSECWKTVNHRSKWAIYTIAMLVYRRVKSTTKIHWWSAMVLPLRTLAFQGQWTPPKLGEWAHWWAIPHKIRLGGGWAIHTHPH